MHNKFFEIYKNLEFWQKVIILVSLLTFITSIVSISIMLNADNIGDIVVSNANFTGGNFSLMKVSFIIILLISLCVFTLVL